MVGVIHNKKKINDKIWKRNGVQNPWEKKLPSLVLLILLLTPAPYKEAFSPCYGPPPFPKSFTNDTDLFTTFPFSHPKS